MLIGALASTAQAQTTVFNDTFGSSTLNGTSTPGGTASASSTSYDIASTKSDTTGPTITSGRLHLALNGGTTAGYMEAQAIFTSTPVQLVNVGDSINMTIVFTNSAGTLLAGGNGSVINVGLYNSGGVTPVPGALNSSGLGTATTYVTGYCQNWQGYVAQLNYVGQANKTFTRPWQTGANNANQDLLYSGAGTGLYNSPSGTQIGSTLTSAVTLTSGATYTLNFTILLSAANTVTLINNLSDANGTLLSAQTNTTAGGNTYTNYANLYDGLCIGVANKGTSMNPQMDVSKITITKNSYAAPTITGLTNLTAIAGNNVALSPVVTGNPSPTYQWYLSTDGGASSNAISGATGSTLTLTNVQYSQDGYQYSLVAMNLVGTNSATMTLSVIVTPSVSGLANQAVYVGDTAQINATVGGVPAPTLLWQHDGVDLTDGLDANGSTISGSTSSSLSIANAQSPDTGTYSLIASNSAGIITNSMYLLVSTTNVPPTLVGPTNITVIEGHDGKFSISSYHGLPQPTLQWLDQTGAPITDATNTSLTIPNVSYSQNGYVYSCVASNSEGSVTNSATLTVFVPPAISSEPSNLVVTNTQSASFSVGATGVPALSYQWSKNGSPIPGATAATYTIASASPSNMGSYSCTITNQAGTTNTVSVTLTVNSTVSVASLSPTNGQTGVCYDTPLYITLSAAPTMRTNGTIKIFNVTNTTTPVDTINLALTSILGVQAHSQFSGDGQSFNYYPVVITGSTIAIYPHSGVMTSNQTYYVTIDDGAFADAAGAYFAGIAPNAWQFTTKPTGPADPVNPVVKADNSADFATVQGAVDSLPLDAAGALRTINIKNGSYFEIVDISGKTNVTLRGQSRSGTVIYYPNNANIAPGGTTHARMTFKINANDVSLDNLTVSNSTPQGGSQAEALMFESNAKRVIVNNCEIDSRQDTILANGSSQSLVYFNNSKITGNFDYMWGGGACYFNNCVIHTISGTGGGNLTAARTDTSATQGLNFPWPNPSGTFSADGFSFVNCTFEADANLGNITLAGSNGTANNLVSWAFCKFATNYVTPSASLFSGAYLFWQYQNTDLTGTNPVSFSTLTSIGVTNNDPRLLAATNVTTWFYGWIPALAPNIVSPPTNLTVNAGNTAAFNVSATGIPDTSYQWLKNGTNLDGQTSATLTISNANAFDIGAYSVVVANASGSVTSSVAMLNVLAPSTGPSLASTAVLANGNVQFSISGSPGSAGFTYRVWATTNLALSPVTSTWTLLTNDTFGSTPVTFTDATASGLPQRFYIITVP